MKRFFLCILFPFLAVHAFCQESAYPLPIHLTRASDNYEGGVYWASTPDSFFVLVDSTGRILTRAKYQKVFHFQDGIAYVVRNDAIGFVNLSGVELGRCMFDWATAPFAHTQFVYRNGAERITLMHNPTSGYVWVTEHGKMVVFSQKDMFSITDKIPDALWDY